MVENKSNPVAAENEKKPDPKKPTEAKEPELVSLPSCCNRCQCDRYRKSFVRAIRHGRCWPVLTLGSLCMGGYDRKLQHHPGSGWVFAMGRNFNLVGF